MGSDAILQQKFSSVWAMLDERTRRIVAANEALALGFGGVSLVHRACGLSRNVIAKGMQEIKGGRRPVWVVSVVRAPGAGRSPWKCPWR